MAERVSVIPLLVVIIVIAAGGAIGVGFTYYHYRLAATPPTNVVRLGDNATVNYIGVFGSGPQAGRVFDTSLYSVASDNITWAKSLGYHARGVAKNYTTLDVHVGGSTPGSGYSLGGLSFIQVVTGFWQGMIGAQPNQTITIVVPPSLGYGNANPSCLRTLPLVQSLPVVYTIPGSQFQKEFPGQLAATGAIFNEPHYGWPILVMNANSSYVTLMNQPTVGMVSHPAGWPVVVTSVQSTANGTGQILLTNELNPAQAGLIPGKDFLGNGPCSQSASGRFIVSAVDVAHGTYTEDFNPEVQGETLVFIVTVVDLFHPVGA